MHKSKQVPKSSTASPTTSSESVRLENGHTFLPAAMSVDDSARYVGVSDTQVRRLMIERGFPRGFMISQNRRVILRADIDRWLAEQAEAEQVGHREEPEPLKKRRKSDAAVR